MEQKMWMNLHILTGKCNHEIWSVMTSNFKIKLQITRRLVSTITSKKPPTVQYAQSTDMWMPLKVQASGTSNCYKGINLGQMQRLIEELRKFHF